MKTEARRYGTRLLAALAALPLALALTTCKSPLLGLVLEEMAVSGRTVAGLAASLPALHMRKRELPCPPNLVYKVIERFRRRHGSAHIRRIAASIEHCQTNSAVKRARVEPLQPVVLS